MTTTGWDLPTDVTRAQHILFRHKEQRWSRADVPSSACLHWEPVIILIMWLSGLMLARGEASPAVSINEPSLDGALISHCTGIVLFTAATSLTLLIPKGFFFFLLLLQGEGRGGWKRHRFRYITVRWNLFVCSCLKVFYSIWLHDIFFN